MGMDLSGMGGYVRFGSSGWARALALGLAFGWTPTGTTPGQSEVRAFRRALRKKGETPAEVERAVRKYRQNYEGIYFGNDGQFVSARDARNLAAALSLAVAAITSERRRKKPSDALPTDEEALEAFRHFSDREALAHLREFVAFCQAGSFNIH